MNPSPDQSPDDPRLLRAVQEYLDELEKGQCPDRDALVARFPDLAEALGPYLDTLDMVHAAAPLLNGASEDGPEPAEAEPLPPEALGDFRIVREIGRGGMGVVYEAVQLSLGRRVALKVLPFAAALDARHLQRFKNEAQAAAHLHHQNIVPVYAVGVERGVHFYAMQLIEGQNLAAVVQQLRRHQVPGAPPPVTPRPVGEVTGPGLAPPVPASLARADTRGGLGVQLSTQRSDRAADFFRAVARLVAQAAEALDYAHGLGVIHRDVKPANLLVDGHGHLWVTDFGLAQVQADAGLTQTGDLLGTLRYMSPEQAAGQRVLLDHRTDIYSLGATLYELLTLRPIFDGADRQTLLRQILHEEPRPPRSLDRAIPVELETVVLKAVSKAPVERYATARDFADDLHRFLRDEPVLARRPTLVQRARKWLRRHPAVPVAAAVLLVVLTAGSLVSAWLIQGEQAKTRLAYEQERQHAEEAEAQFRLARRAVDEMIRLAEEELADNPFQQDLRKRLLESALAYYQEFIELHRDDPETEAGLAATQARVKKILSDLAVLQGAGQLFLLSDQAVLDDLHLSDEQREQITEFSRRLAEQREEAFREFHRLTAEERRQRFLDLARANEAAVSEILTPQQRHRFRQIVLQLEAPGVFRQTDVARALKLTPQQKARIRTIEADTFSGMPKPPRDSPRREDMRKIREELRKKASTRILAVLTKEQVKLWHEMTGAPFKGLTSSRPPPAPPGPPR